MKKIFQVITILAIAVLLSSCALSRKLSVVPSTAISSDNFTYVRDVEASANYTYIFGIGGLKDKDIHKRLEEKANLQPGEVLANVTVDSDTKCYLGIVIKSKFVIRGTVVKFK